MNDREVTRNHVDDITRHEKRGYLARAGFKKRSITIFNTGHTTNAGANINTDAFGVGFRDFQSGIGNGLRASSNTVINAIPLLNSAFAIL